MLRRFATRRKQQLGQTLGTSRTGFLENMPVDVQRKRHARMAQLLGDQPEWNALAKSERSKTVTQIVQTQVRKVSELDQRLEASLDQISFVDWAAPRALKDQSIRFETRTNASPHEFRDLSRECHGPPAPRAFGLSERPLSMGTFERPGDRKRRTCRIKIRNAQRQVFARAQTCAQCDEEDQRLRIGSH